MEIYTLSYDQENQNRPYGPGMLDGMSQGSSGGTDIMDGYRTVPPGRSRSGQFWDCLVWFYWDILIEMIVIFNPIL